MNSSQLWHLHQRHKFLRAEASRDIFKIRVSEMAMDAMLFRQNTRAPDRSRKKSQISQNV